MNKLLIAFTILMTGSMASFANDPAIHSTDMNSKWMCTTNASSSDVAADKAADDKMAKETMAAKKGFEFAAKHCRDCTKITCEVSNK